MSMLMPFTICLIWQGHARSNPAAPLPLVKPEGICTVSCVGGIDAEHVKYLWPGRARETLRDPPGCRGATNDQNWDDNAPMSK
jgi:hypothetical protein